MLNSLFFKTKKNRKLVKLRKSYTKKNFDELMKTHKIHFKTKTKEKTANFIIMYDINVPYGIENNSSKKIFVHYLKIQTKKYLKFYKPNPPKGTHNYICISAVLNEEEIKILEENINENIERTDEIFQNLGKKKILNIKLNKNNIIRMNKFKVSLN